MSKRKDQGESKKLVSLRQQAEEVVRSKQQKELDRLTDLSELSAEEASRLVHELQVHQIELDLQNEELRRVQQKLEASRDKYADLYDFAPIGYFTIDKQGLILEVNLAGADLLGVDRSRLMNKPMTRFVARNSQDKFYLHRQRVIETGTRQSFELELVKKDGSQFYGLMDCITVPDRAGNFSKFRVALTDITERKRAEAHLHHQERMAAVGQLAGGIAHDFNNILTSIMGFAELIKRDPNTSQSARQDLERITQQGGRAAQLVRQLLDFSRRSISQQRPMDLVSSLQQSFKLLERTIPENVGLRLEYMPGQYWVKADRVQLEQVFLNLAVNARDAMPDGGTLDFALSKLLLAQDDPPPVPGMPSGEWLAVRASDTGEGIPKEVLPHVFEPFFTTKPVGEGTGLGLAQVHGIVEQHGGYIDVSSQVGKGTTFMLYLSSLPLPAETLPDVAEEAPYSYGRGETLLLVEDEPAVLEVAQALLEHLGYQVLTTTNGREALEVYDQHRDEIALVLTDITMPEMGGIALAQALRERDPALKVVALTGYALEAEAKDLLAQGIVEWLEKPLDLEQLAQVVSRLLKLNKLGF